MFLTVIFCVLVACPALLMCAIFGACWVNFKEDRETHPIYRQAESSLDPELNDNKEKCCA